MNADAIRETSFEHDDGAWESARWLREIAAQLAEIKELLNGKAVERIVSALEGIERK